jgi:transposase
MPSEMGTSRRQYSSEFKVEAVRLSERGDKTVRQVAEDLGIREKVLHRWRREQRVSRQAGTRFAPGHGQARDEELERLKKDNQLLRLERDVLKKAMAFLMPRPS